MHLIKQIVVFCAIYNLFLLRLTELSLCRSTFHFALRKLNTEPSMGASHQISAHFGKAVSEKKIFRNQPI
jgi:hypothetical protein